MQIVRAKDLVYRFYPLELPFAYVAIQCGRVIRKGTGETSEISSNQVRWKALDLWHLKPTVVIMSVAWPAKLADGTSLQLVLQVQPVGTDTTSFRILKHEFRTAPKTSNDPGMHAEVRAGGPLLRLIARRAIKEETNQAPQTCEAIHSICDRRNELSN